MPTAAELIFKIQAVGTDQLKQVAATVDAVRQGTQLAGAQLKTFDSTLNALAASGKTYTQALEEMARSNGVLSNSVRATASALLDQIKAADGDAEAIRRLSGAHAQLTGNVLQARTAVQALNGNLSTMAAGRWLASISGLGPLLSGIFSVAGPLAFGAVAVKALTDLYNEWNPVLRAQKESLDVMKSLNAEYARLGSQDQTRTYDLIQRTQGRAARLLQESRDAAADAKYGDESAIQYAQSQIAKAQARIKAGTSTSGGFWDKNGNPIAVQDSDALAAQASLPGLSDRLGLAQLRQKTDRDKATDLSAAADDAKKEEDKKAGAPAAELAKRRAQELLNLQQQLGEAQTKELSTYDKIAAKRDDQIAKLKAENLLTKDILQTIDQIAAAETKNATTSTIALIAKVQGENRTQGGKIVDNAAKESNSNQKFDGREFLASLKKTIEDEEKDLAGLLHAISRGDQSAADQVRQRAGLAIYENNKGTGSGSHGGTTAADANYQVRIKAANDIFAIETRHLDLITEEGKREDALADARKKNADELYNAEREHEEALDALREKDIQKYHTLAESVFDALTDRMHGSGWDFREMFRGAAHTLGSQVFANATQGIFQTGGHALASLSGGSTFGGLLKGTVFDPANKGVHADPHQLQIEQHTKDTADWLSKLYQLASGQQSSDPAGANPSASPAGAAAVSGSLNPLASMMPGVLASLPPALGGTGAATTAASAASGLSGFIKAITGAGGSSSAFGSGLSSVMSGDALSNALGYGTPGVTVAGPGGLTTTLPGYAPTTGQQIGSAVGLAGALAASALSIASGAQQGGVAGGLKIAGGAVGAGVTVASNVAKLLGDTLPAAIPVIGSVIAAALPLIGGLFGTGPQQRANQITNELAQNAFLPNTALNTIQNTNGTLLSMDAHGNLRTSSLNALPTVAEPYITSERLNGSPYRTYANAPGGVTQGYSGSVTGTGQAPVSNAPTSNAVPQVHFHINAIDTQSGVDFIVKNHQAVGDAVTNHLTSGGGERLATMLRFHVG